MEPIGRPKAHLDPNRHADDGEAQEQDDQGSRPIARILGRQVQVADFAAIANGQEAGIERASPAAWAAAGEARLERRYLWIVDRLRPLCVEHDRTLAPPVDADEEEQPDDIDEMPIPGRRLEAEMMIRLKMTLIGSDEANDQEDRADDDMETVKAGRHEKR